MAITVQPAAPRTIDRARQQLRRDQEIGALKYGSPPRPAIVSGLDMSLRFLNSQHGFEETSNPNTVRRGIFKFDRVQELRRLSLSEHLLRRIDAGFSPALPPEANPAWVDEFMADQSATILSVLSGFQLDSVTPEFPLGSANFELACMEILRRAPSIVQTGEANPPWADNTHPPNNQRMNNNVQAFYQFFDAVYDGPFLKDLTFFVKRQGGEVPKVPGSVRKQIQHSFDFSNSLHCIWERVAPRLVNDYANHRQLHPIWLPQSGRLESSSTGSR